MNTSRMKPMNHKLTRSASALAIVASIALTSAFTGCQSVYNGQVLPSGHFRDDDVQYFAPGPEFKLAREAAAMEEQKAAIESSHQGR